MCAAVRLPVGYDRGTSLVGPVRGYGSAGHRKVGDATPAFPRQDAGRAATPRLNGQVLAVSNRQRAVVRQARESSPGGRRVSDFATVALAMGTAHTALCRATGRLRDPPRFPVISPGQGTSVVGPIAGPNVRDDAVFRRRRGPVLRPQGPTDKGRAALGGVASVRFTRERSQVRNPPRPHQDRRRGGLAADRLRFGRTGVSRSRPFQHAAAAIASTTAAAARPTARCT
jgi:hypothetical protein